MNSHNVFVVPNENDAKNVSIIPPAGPRTVSFDPTHPRKCFGHAVLQPLSLDRSCFSITNETTSYLEWKYRSDWVFDPTLFSVFGSLF